MQYDGDLVRRVRAVARKTERQADADRWLSDWETACYLSNLGDPNRAAHWERRAAALQRQLLRFVAGETQIEILAVAR